MNAAALAGTALVPALGIMMVLTAVITRRTVPFGVRIPFPERIMPPVISRERHRYLRRTTLVCVCATAIALALHGHGGQWLSRVILIAEVAADLVCLRLARRNIIAVKQAEGWYDGVRQTVTTDTGWHADPPRFPVVWLVPALAVLAATAVVGVLRYPHLPARLSAMGGGSSVRTSPIAAFGFVIGQVYVTTLATALLLVAYRARPDIETRDPAGSAARQRAIFTTAGRAILTVIAGVNLTLLLAALKRWQLWQFPGAAQALIPLPFVLALAALILMLWRTWRSWSAPEGSGAATGSAPAARADRDDDQFWKLGLIYFNSGDPSLAVTSRFGLGWTLNLGNPRAWLLIAGVWAVPAGMAAILLLAGA
jgi:uncharacterized membrane protein